MVVNQEISIFNMAKVFAICVSEKRGIQKHIVDSVILKENHGIVGDAHADSWHRQISILDKKEIDEFNEKGANVFPGAFGENLILEGLDLKQLEMRDRIQVGEAILEFSQRGKECHTHCAIYHKMGECIMPVKGIFFEVIKGGRVKVGDEVKKIDYPDKPFTVAVVTISDRCFNKEQKDISGPTISKRLKENGYQVIEEVLLPDNFELIKKELERLCDQREVNLILTTGGTGFSSRDVTPEATLAVMERNVPGISEVIRAESMKITKHAMLSRAVSVIHKKTLIINLPGSPKACTEAMDVFLDTIPHGLRLLKGEKVDK